MTIKEAFAQYDLEMLVYKNMSQKTRDNYKGLLKSLLNVVADIPIQLLTYEHVVMWQQDMDRRGLAPATVASMLGRTRKVMRYLKRRKIDTLDADEIELPKVIRGKVNFLYPVQIQAMIDASPSSRDKALIAMMFSSGARITEMLSLDRGDIVDGKAEIIGKGSKPGTLSFDTTALEYLEDYLATRTDPLNPLFTSPQRKRLGYTRANQIIHEAADLAGIKMNVSTHTLRHSFATDMMLNGASIMEVKEHLRHENVSTTMRYLHVTDAHKRESYEKHHTVLVTPRRVELRLRSDKHKHNGSG